MTDQVTDSNAKMSELPHAHLQAEAHRKFGNCLLHLQHYEMALKKLLSTQNVLGSPENLQSFIDKKVAVNSNKTLGQLVAEFTKDFIQPTLHEPEMIDQNDLGSAPQPNSSWFSMKSSMRFSSERHAEISQQLKELVDLRNFLVHHFIERFDVHTESGCRGANLHLDDCYKKIDNHYLTLTTWAMSMDKTRSYAAAFMSSPAFWDAIDADLKP